MTGERGISGIYARKVKPLPWPLMIIFLSLITAIVVSGFFYYQKQKQAALREQTAQLQAVADLKAGEIGNWLSENLNDARLIAENSILTVELLAFLADRGAGPRQESILAWMRSLQNNYHYQNVMLLDKSGQVALALTGLYPAIGREGVELMEAARGKRSAVLSDLHRNPSGPAIHMDLVAPLLATGKVVGFVLLRIDPDRFLFPMIQSWPTPSSSAETLLVRREEDDVLFLNELRHRQDTAMKLRIALTSKEIPAVKAALGETGAFSGKDYRGIAVWSVLKPVPSSNWSIVAKIDREEIERPIRRSALAIFLVALSLILAAALLILFLWQRQNARFSLRQLEAESQRQALVRHFEYLSRYANDLILLSDSEHNIIEANERAVQAYGYSREQLLAMNLRMLRVPSERESLGDDYRQAKERDGIIFETMHQRRDGSTFPLEVSARVIRSEGKEYFQSIYRDITARKQAEDALRRNEKDLRESQRIAHVGSWHLNVADNQVVWTEELYNMYGFDPSIPPPPYSEHMKLFTPESWEKLSMALARTRETGIPYTLELETVIKDGNNGWMWVRGEVEVDSAGKTVGLWGVAQDITERKQAEETIRQSAARLRSVLDATPFPIAIVDVQDSKIDFWSSSALALFGHTAPTTAEWYELAYPDPAYRREVVERWKPFLKEAQQSGQAVNTGEYRITCRDGSARICELYATFLAENLIVTFNDISARKQAENKLQRLSERNQALLEAIPDIIMEVDADKVYTWANHAGIAFFGADVIGHEAGYYFEGEQKTYQQIKPLFNGHDENIYVESWQRRRDGEKRLLAWWCRVLKDESGKVTGALSSGRDITVVRLAEEALQESERKFRETVVTLDEGYYSVTLDGKLLEHNQAFNRILGFAIHEDLKGIQLPDFWQDPDQRKDYLMAFAASGSISNYQIEAKTQGGDRITILASAHLIKEKNDRPQRIEGVFLEITERMRAEAEIKLLNEELEQRVLQRTAQLEAANKELEAFSYSVSHDLRAPLRAIDGFSRIVLEEYSKKLDDEGRRLLGVISGNTKKMAQLIDDLLAFSRLSRQKMASAPVKLGAIANVVFSELKSLEGGRRIELEVGVLPAAHGDHSMLQQVLQNLLANAIKFTRTRNTARIELGGKVGNGENVFYVKDNGVGFDMQYVSKLFGVFQRLHGADEFEGTGVGLAIVQRIITRHGGRVWAENKGGKGATFYFSLPTDQGLGSRV